MTVFVDCHTARCFGADTMKRLALFLIASVIGFASPVRADEIDDDLEYDLMILRLRHEQDMEDIDRGQERARAEREKRLARMREQEERDRQERIAYELWRQRQYLMALERERQRQEYLRQQAEIARAMERRVNGRR